MNYRMKKACALLGIFIIFLAGFTGFLKQTADTASAVEAQLPAGYVSYVVKSGDSLWSIAQENIPFEREDIGDFVEELKHINKLQSDYIYDGQLIAVPYYEKTTVVCAVQP